MKRTPLLLLVLGLTMFGMLLISTVASAASVNCSGVTAWVAGGNYTVGELATYQGSEYKCLQANNDAAPNWDPIDWPAGWSLVGTCSGSGPTATATKTATKTATAVGTATQTATKTATAVGTPTKTATKTATPTATATPCQVNCGGPSNGRYMVGYWHDWETPEWIQLANVPSSYDVIVVAFANYNGSGNFSFTVDPDETQAQFIADVATLHSKGKKVIISCGGATETPTFSSASDASNFANSVASMMNTFGFDGVDIDFENGAVYLNANDLNISSPTTPSVVYLIQALNDLHSLKPNALITFAPIPNYLQAAYQYYGPGPYGDSNWNGAQLPVINNIRNILTWVWPQYYNEANIEGLDGNLYSEGSVDNLVAMTEMLTKGFPVAYNAGTFAPLKASQVSIGIPACSEASPGNMTNAQLESAFSYLVGKGSKPGSYTLSGTYPGLAGFMTWSINWDVYCQNGGLASGIRSYLNGI